MIISKLMIVVKRNIQTPQNLLGRPCQMYYMKHERFRCPELA